jgi:predicted metal-binding protein
LETSHEAIRPILSICLRCRDGREADRGHTRGGARLARAVLQAGGAGPVRLRGVQCMSQCKRPCVVSLTAAGRFTYLFGDLDPDSDARAILSLVQLYVEAPEGFLTRDARPERLRAGILARLPPLGTASDLVLPLGPDFVPETLS